MIGNTIESNYAALQSRIAAARARSRHSQAVQLIAVSKGQSDAAVQAFIEICQSQGHTAVLGENYVQEWQTKKTRLTGKFQAHFIGSLQSNKAAVAAHEFDVIETVHSEKIAIHLSKHAQKLGKVLPVFLQVNISRDPSKSGFLPEHFAEAVAAIRALPGLRAYGVMTITKEYERPEEARSDFAALRALRDSIDPAWELSMGMSSDFEVAIEEGATLVRVGTALFGARSG